MMELLNQVPYIAYFGAFKIWFLRLKISGIYWMH